MISHVKIVIGEQSEPHTYRTAEKNLRHIYIYIYTFVRRARAVHAQTSDRPVEVQRSILENATALGLAYPAARSYNT